MSDKTRQGNCRRCGLIYDVDGVLVDSPHERSWGDALTLLFETREPWRRVLPQSAWRPNAYTQDVYLSVAAGKSRRDGARALLAHFRIPDENGALCDDLYHVKQDVFLDLVERGEFKVFDDAVRFALEAHWRGYRQAVASSSRNATRLLTMVRLAPFCAERGLRYEFVGESSRLIDLFEADVCGRPFPRGKPAPDIFLGAAAELKLAPADCVVFEDAVSGVRATKAGAMLCVAVARLGDEEALRQAGADIVVSSLDQLRFEQLDTLLPANAASQREMPQS